MQKLSLQEAVSRFEVSRPTLYRDMKSGKVSYETKLRDARVIEASELERVYRAKADSESPDNANKDKMIALLQAQQILLDCFA